MDLPASEGVIICNPPYGQRMMEQQSAQRLYAAFGKRADKKRKLYNGMIKCDYYMYTDNQRKKK